MSKFIRTAAVVEVHKAKMARKATRVVRPDLRRNALPARINRHTGRPHEHKREIARRMRQSA